MKSKKLFKRLTALVLTAVMSFSCVSTALAATLSTTKTTESHLNGWGYDFRNSKVTSKAYDPVTKGYTNASFMKSNGQFCLDYLAYWKDSDGKYCYCVQHGRKHYNNITSNVKDLYDAACYPEDMEKLLDYATVYSYKGTTKYGYSKDVELAASQVIIWNISAGYFDSTSTSVKSNSNEKYVLDCIIVPDGKEDDFLNCYNKMKADILGHTTIPSGTANEKEIKTDVGKAKVTYTLTYNTSEKKWECEIKSNKFMKCFDLEKSISGVTVTHSGNNLKITCTDAGAKTLASKTSVKFIKARSVSGNSIDECTPVYIAAESSQDKISYNLTNNDPVEAYVAFEMSTGSFTMDKKLNNTSTSITKSEYITYDKTVGAKLKYTWDKTYKWDDSTSKWVEYKNAPTSNPTFSAGLRNIIRFKVKNSAGQYVVATGSGTVNFKFSKFDNSF